MTFVENGQWVIALYQQNEVREVQARPGGRRSHFRCTRGASSSARSTRWCGPPPAARCPWAATCPTSGRCRPGSSRCACFPTTRICSSRPGARGFGAIYTDYAEMVHILRKVFMRVSAKLDWLILKLH